VGCLDLADLAKVDAPRWRGALNDPGLERYTTRELLEQEQRIAHWFTRASANAREPASDEQIGRAFARLAARDDAAPTLDPQQAHAATLAAGTNRAVVIVGPAGAGKTTTLRVAVEALHDDGHRVVGLAPTAIAAKRLAEATGLECENVARYLAEHERPDGINAALALRPGDTLIVDEAAMLTTPDYERLLTVAGSNGLRLVLVGDQRQLAAVGHGGMFDQARQLVPSVELEEIHRFSADWEAAASSALRAGDAAAIDAYEAHDRIRYGSAEEMTEAILTDWWQAWQQGNSQAFSAPTNDQVRCLNARAQETRLGAGELRPGRALRNAHDELITAGDVVATRQNAPQLRLRDGGYVRNRDTWTVAQVADDGALVLRDERGAQVAVPVGYAKEHVELAYFRTTHGVQGVTERVGERAQRIQEQLATARRRDHPPLRDELARHHSDESVLRDQLAELDNRGLAVATAGRHPGQWLEHDGRAAGEWTQVAHELDRRREHSIRAAEQAAIQMPARYIVAAIGERPAAGDQRRDHWDRTAKALERHRITHNIDVDRDGPIGPRPPDGRKRLAWQQLEHDIAHARGDALSRDLGLGIER
jgi:thymidine kinase